MAKVFGILRVRGSIRSKIGQWFAGFGLILSWVISGVVIVLGYVAVCYGMYYFLNWIGLKWWNIVEISVYSESQKLGIGILSILTLSAIGLLFGFAGRVGRKNFKPLTFP